MTAGRDVWVFGAIIFIMTMANYNEGRKEQISDLNLEEVVEEFVSSLVKVHGVVEWWDITGKDPRLTLHASYEGQKVEVRSSSMQFGELEDERVVPSRVVSRTFTNTRKSTKLTFKMQEKTSMEISSSWHTLLGILTEMTQTTKVKVPFVTITRQTDMGMELKSGTKETTVEKTESQVIEKFVVRPRTELLVDWVVERIEQVRNWTVDVMISGHIVVCYQSAVNGKQLHAYPVSQIKHTMLEVVSSTEIKFVSRGVYTGEGADSYLRVDERKIRKTKTVES